MFTYDKQGLGFAEMTRLALTHSRIFTVVYWMVDHNLSKTAIVLTRLIVR